MFSGIVEAQSKVISQQNSDQVLRFVIEKPADFSDLHIGDSIATNGVCLTIEKFDQQTMQFCLGAETLKVLGAAAKTYLSGSLNLERSLKFGDRMHGHMVTGHADGVAQIVETYAEGESWILKVQIPSEYIHFFWKKGSICLNGVSLTVNNAVTKKDCIVEVCLVPETIKKTNLTSFKKSDFITFEADYFAKTVFQYQQQLQSQQESR